MGVGKLQVQHSRVEDNPYQLYSDLRSRTLRDYHPITKAAMEVKELEDKARLGVLRLCDCHEEPPRG